MNEFANTVLGSRYKLIEEIGSGGMAFVYKATDIRLNRNVAVKLLKTEFIGNKEFVQKFSFEAMSAASLTHPNIVSIYDAGYDKNLFYIVMELIEGITLRDLIEKKKFLKWKDALSVTKQILSAMEVAHKNNIIHRDIKPHNIMLTYDGNAKVADFGIAKMISSNSQQSTEENIGSVHYISPEQAKGEAFDERADLYSIGITLYEMLVGNVPFDGETASEVAWKNINEPITSPGDFNPAIPVGVSDFVLRATNKKPDDRYQSATDMLSSLQVVLLIPNEHLSYASPEKNERDDRVERQPTGVKPVESNANYRRGPKQKSPTLGDFVKKNYKTLSVTVAAIITAIAILSMSLGNISSKLEDYCTAKYTVIDFVGQNYFQVAEKLNKLGIKTDYIYVRSDTVAKDTIMSQNPLPGQIISPGTTNEDGEDGFVFYVSNEADSLQIKDYSPKTTDGRVETTDIRIVERDFNNSGVIIEYINMHSPDIPVDHILATRPGAWEYVDDGEILYVYRSAGPQGVITAGNYKGLSESAAKSQISAAGLTTIVKKIVVEEEEPTGDEVPAPKPPEKVLAQYPEPGVQMKEGEKVILYMSSPENFRTTKTIHLENDSKMNISDIFDLKIEVTYSDTGTKEELYNSQFEKSQMPFVFEVMVPLTGESKVDVYVNNVLYCNYFLKADVESVK